MEVYFLTCNDSDALDRSIGRRVCAVAFGIKKPKRKEKNFKIMFPGHRYQLKEQNGRMKPERVRPIFISVKCLCAFWK